MKSISYGLSLSCINATYLAMYQEDHGSTKDIDQSLMRGIITLSFNTYHFHFRQTKILCQIDPRKMNEILSSYDIFSSCFRLSLEWAWVCFLQNFNINLRYNNKELLDKVESNCWPNMLPSAIQWTTTKLELILLVDIPITKALNFNSEAYYWKLMGSNYNQSNKRW